MIMTLEQCYAQMNADYEDTIRRIPNKKLIQKILLKFPKDESYRDLCSAMEEKRMRDAFTAVHTMKGICLNLGLRELSRAAVNLTEALRNDPTEKVPELFTELKSVYGDTMSVIEKYRDEQEDA
ncbi:MAG: Hpt domain-containing protein [Lachnospiraceae bacterium]|nr:Hpt domain-containing protein [Agathobacter sp.]MDD6446085.1 Hpt domain-containing protein [Lachnospiraceae bacterium]MDY4893994.1 Hpt domain-containing protein [Agathobacter sp.]